MHSVYYYYYTSVVFIEHNRVRHVPPRVPTYIYYTLITMNKRKRIERPRRGEKKPSKETRSSGSKRKKKKLRLKNNGSILSRFLFFCF